MDICGVDLPRTPDLKCEPCGLSRSKPSVREVGVDEDPSRFVDCLYVICR